MQHRHRGKDEGAGKLVREKEFQTIPTIRNRTEKFEIAVN